MTEEPEWWTTTIYGIPVQRFSFLFGRTAVLLRFGTLKVKPNYGAEDFFPKSCVLEHQIR